MKGQRRYVRPVRNPDAAVLTAEQAGTMLGLTRGRTYKMLEHGTFPVPARKPGGKVGSHWQILRADVERLLAQGSAETPRADNLLVVPDLLRRLLSGEQVRIELRLRLLESGCEVDAVSLTADGVPSVVSLKTRSKGR